MTASTCYLRCSCGVRVDAATRPGAWLLLDAHVESVHGRTFPARVTDHVVSDVTQRAHRRKAKRNGAA